MVKPNSFDGMMNEYCVRCGYCGGSKDGVRVNVRDFVPKTGEVSVYDFVDWLILAEGMDPSELGKEMQRRKSHLRSIFRKHMGSDLVQAERLTGEFH